MSFGKIISWVGIPVSEMKMTLMRNEIDEMFNLKNMRILHKQFKWIRPPDGVTILNCGRSVQ